MRHANEFDEVFYDEGGWFNPERFHPFDRSVVFDWLRPRIENLIGSHLRNTFSPLKVHFDYIDHESFNASVRLFELQDTAFIGLNVGAVATIFNYFHQLLSHPNWFLNVGKPTRENTREKTIRVAIFFTDGSMHLDDKYEKPFVGYIPNDPVRLHYARLLSVHAIDFLIEHEIAHILSGHTSLLMPYRRNLDNFSKQVLEWDADCWAVTQGLSRVINGVKNPESNPEEVRWVYKSLEMAISAWVFSIASLFHLCESEPTNFDKLDHPDHPFARLRFYSILSTTLECISKKSSNDFVRRFDEMNCGVDDFIKSEKIFSELTEKPFPREEIRKTFSKQGMIYLNNLDARWKEIRPLLEPFAYVKLPD